jgi:oligoribonuclease (3'-5' exoribonuclease)
VESTGLDERKDHLLEVAMVVTDDDLNELDCCSVVMKPVGVLIDQVQMDPKVLDMHTKNGLLDEVRALEAADGMRLYQAEQLLLDFISRAFRNVPPVASEKCAHCGRSKNEHESRIEMCAGGVDLPCLYCVADGYFNTGFHPKLMPAVTQTPLAGSTIGFDRKFLRQYMPKLESKFSYRSIDVSSLVELAKRWAPEIYKARPKGGEESAHRALADIRVSIEYLRFFRVAGFLRGESLS